MTAAKSFYGTFGTDHSVSRLLRGKERPAPGEVKGWLRRRMAWLEYRITSDGRDGKVTGLFEGELRALAVALETYLQAGSPGDAVKPNEEKA